ncbi:MAG: MBOAT family protein [Rhizobiaceae bacterium]|jgi:alginate O-acetyltransferase complex protein AlgI|nr:MBOAT family protein [Rhizobiaceae bacterium]
MVFSSNIFLFAFLPLFLGAYYLTPPPRRSLTIVIGSWLFYAWWRVDFLALYAGVTVWSYWIGIRIGMAEADSARLSPKRWMQIGVTGSLLVLGYFKYYNFFGPEIAALLGVSEADHWLFFTVILPIGVSFFVFESISYMVDVYRKDAPPARNFTDFAAFLALYPHLIAGPVMKYKDLAAQIVERSHTLSKFSEGVVLFMIGFCKKVLIADSVAPLAGEAFRLTEPTLAEAWLGAVAYTIQLYFDFSGYSLMAIGLGLMIGFRLIKNFDTPYLSLSITEFWRRWHISLSTWLRDYLYIALGGNRKGRLRTHLNLWLTMVLGGLWHGANWTFILWGLWHGTVLVIERLLGAKGGRSPYPAFIAWPLTIVLVIIGWVMFRAHSVSEAMAVYGGMAGLNGIGLTPEFAWKVTGLELAMLAAGIVLVFTERFVRPRHFAGRFKVPGISRAGVSRASLAHAGLAGLTGLAVLKLSADAYSPFLYFQF